MRSWRLAFVGAFLLAAGTAYGGTDPSVAKDRVLVVYNSTFGDYDDDGIPDSEAVAWYYVLRRGVPAQNLLAVDCTWATDYNRYYYLASEWMDFRLDVLNLIKQKLNNLGADTIDYIVLCYGVPYRFGAPLQSGSSYNKSVPAALVDVFGVELPADNTYANDDFDPNAANPFFDDDPTQGGRQFNHTDFKFGTNEMYLSTVLEGADSQHIFDSIEGCKYGDMYVQNTATGYRGIFYVDKRYGSSALPADAAYPVARGNDNENDRNLGTIPYWLDNLGTAWPYNFEYGGGVVGDGVATWAAGSVDAGQPADSAPQALFYAGWRHHTPDPPYYDVFEWLPGSVALLLEKVSPLHNVRIPPDPLSLQFGTHALSAGASCCVGRLDYDTGGAYYNNEAYPDIAAWYLLNGYNFAEAVYAGAPQVKNMLLPVGDPIYCPMYAGQDDGSIVEPSVMIGDGPQANSKMISVYAGTMEGGATELYRFRLDVGATQDSLQTLYDYDDSPQYSIYQRYIVTQLADGTPLQPAQVYWFRAYAMDACGNVSQAPLSAFSTEGDISYPSLQTQVIDPSSGLDDRYPSSNYPDGLFQNTHPMWLQEWTADRILYRLDGVSLASDALILKAALKVYWLFRSVSGGTNPTPVYVYAMQRDWTPSEVCWLRAATGQDWAREGIACGGITTAMPPVLMPVERSYYPVSLPLFEGAGIYENGDPPVRREIDITGIVREWAAGTTANYGVVLNNPNDGAGSSLAFYADTSGAATQPELHIYWCYEPPTVTLVVEAPAVWGIDEGTTQDVILTATTVKPDPARVIDRYEWDFDGDGTVDRTTTTPSTTPPAQTFTYQPSAQAYTATVTVYDDKTNATASAQVIVTTKPVAIIDIPSAYVLVDQPMTLDGSGSYDPDGSPIVSYDWDSAGTPIGSGQTVTYTWTSAGSNPLLTLTVNDGLVDGTTSITIHVRDAAGMPPGTDVEEADMKLLLQDLTGCLAPWVSVDGVRFPLDGYTTKYEVHTATATVTVAGSVQSTVTMLDASGNSSQLEVEITETVVP